MTRRNFLKTTSIVTAGLLLPSSAFSDSLDFNQIQFDADLYNANNAQTIMMHLVYNIFFIDFIECPFLLCNRRQNVSVKSLYT